MEAAFVPTRRTLALMAAYVLAGPGCRTQVSPSSKPSVPVNLAQACDGHEGWDDPAPPTKVFGNVYLVGTCGIVALLITSDQGHVLIDGATAAAAPLIAKNIETLGFKLRDVRILLISHEHLDHVGGLADLKQRTGAQVLARADAQATLETGEAHAVDPQFGALPKFAGVGVDRIIADGESVGLGALRLTAVASPGHAPGGTSWVWQACEGETCYGMVYADSLSAVAADAYRYSDHPDYVTTFRATMARVKALPSCDILITPHPAQSEVFARVSGLAPLVDATACARYATHAETSLAQRLASEAPR